MKIILWVLLGGIVLFFGSAFVAGIVEAIREDKKTAHREREIEERYPELGDLDQHKGDTPQDKLLRLAKKAIKGEDLDKAWEYLEQCQALGNCSKAKIVLAEYYAAAGDREQAAKLLTEEKELGINADAHYLSVLLHLTDCPEEELKKGYAAATKFPGTCTLYAQARKQLVQDAIDSYGETAVKAQKLAKEGDPAGAAELCKKLYALIVKFAEKDERAQCRETLVDLAWQTAVYCCGTGDYQQYEVAQEYLDKENCSGYPTYYYIRMLARTKGGVSGFEDTAFLYKALYEDVERAIREGLPGAAQVKERLQKTFLRATEIQADNARFEVEQMEAEEAFEQAHGMSREEYAQHQKELREEQDRAVREREMREKLEWEERFGFLTDGTGRDVEQREAEGAISYGDYLRYNSAKERYIKKKSQ